MPSLAGTFMGALGDDGFNFDPGAFASDPGGLATISDSGDSGVGWGDALVNQLPSLVRTGENILTAQFGGPKPGQFFSRGANGQSVAYALPSNSHSNVGSGNPFGSGGFGFGESIGGLLPLLVLGGGAVLLFSLLGKK